RAFPPSRPSRARRPAPSGSARCSSSRSSASCRSTSRSRSTSGWSCSARCCDLGPRMLHHDESLHALYSWYLYTGKGYVHDPMMHGPTLFEIGALMYFLFGATDAVARVGTSLFGVALVGMVWL